MNDFAAFFFILVLPVVIVAGAVATLFVLGALFDALDHPEELSARVAAAFKPKARPARMAGPKHYYQPYWKS